jgi:hypothetical protein
MGRPVARSRMRAGDLLFFSGGKIDFWDLSSSLVINNNSYTLAKNLKQLAADVKQDPQGFHALANDYDAGQDGTYTRAPVKTVEGTFEGLGHSVANLSINSVSDAGLFHAANFAATLRDIDIANATVICTNAYPKAGILTGDNYGIVEHASASGSIQIISSGRRGLSSVGGLVGLNAGSIADSDAAVNVSATDNTAAGGLVGYSAPDALVERARASGNVFAGSSAFAGGLAGLREGVAGIPPRWLGALRGRDRVDAAFTFALAAYNLIRGWCVRRLPSCVACHLAEMSVNCDVRRNRQIPQVLQVTS